MWQRRNGNICKFALRDMILENMRLRIIKNCKGILKLSHNNNFGIRQHSYNPFESDLYDTQHMPHTWFFAFLYLVPDAF